MVPQVLLLPHAFAGPLTQVVARHQVHLDWRDGLEPSGGRREQLQHAQTSPLDVQRTVVPYSSS